MLSAEAARLGSRGRWRGGKGGELIQETEL